ARSRSAWRLPFLRRSWRALRPGRPTHPAGTRRLSGRPAAFFWPQGLSRTCAASKRHARKRAWGLERGGSWVLLLREARAAARTGRCTLDKSIQGEGSRGGSYLSALAACLTAVN